MVTGVGVVGCCRVVTVIGVVGRCRMVTVIFRRGETCVTTCTTACSIPVLCSGQWSRSVASSATASAAMIGIAVVIQQVIVSSCVFVVVKPTASLSVCTTSVDCVSPRVYLVLVEVVPVAQYHTT